MMKNFSQLNFRKSHQFLDQFNKSIKRYIKMFEAVLLGPTRPLSAQIGLKLQASVKNTFVPSF